MATLNAREIVEYAKRLDRSADERTETVMFAEEAGVDLDTAYIIQDTSLQLRAARGDKMIGWKMGLTSKAKMEQMGVDSPICGVLTESMRIIDGGEMEFKDFIHPKVEPEIAFHIREDIPADVSARQLPDYIERVCCGIEIIDSRFKDFKFTLKDVIADNCSSSGFVLSKETFAPSEVDLGNLGMLLEINNEVVQAGSSAAIYDHPLQSLAACVKMLAARGKSIQAGEIVLAGAATAAVLIQPGDRISTRVQGLGSCSFEVL